MTVTQETVTALIFKKVFVTSEMAQHWLDNCNKGNRKLKPSKYNQYAKSMTRGQWHETHAAIAFYKDGTLADGQHRLMAIVVSKVGQWLNVCEGLEKESMPHIDRGAVRTDLDVITFAGTKTATSSKVAVMRCLVMEAKSQRDGVRWVPNSFQPDRLIELYDQFKDKIEWITNADRVTFSKAPAAVWAALIAASYTEDYEKIERFAEIITMRETVGVEEHEQAALKLRAFLGSGNAKNSWVGRQSLFYKTCSALRYFIKEQQLNKLFDTKGSAFSFEDCLAIELDSVFNKDDR
jgi:hypothetical protein